MGTGHPEAQRHTEGRRDLGAGMSAYWRAWSPAGQPRALVVVVHGFGEHSGRYHDLGTRLAAAGFAGYAADHRGHGRSSGRGANIGRMALLVDDLDSFVDFAVGQVPGVPVFLLGHSLGGLIALQYATEPGTADLDGLVISGPAVEVTVGSAALRRVAGLLSALVPDLGVADLRADRKISRDPEVVRAYQQDPLVHHGKVPARTGAEVLRTAQALPARLARLDVPLLLLHGGDDLICPPAGSTMVHDTVASADRTLRQYPGLYHEVFNEPERDEVVADVVAWIDKRLPTREAPTG